MDQRAGHRFSLIVPTLGRQKEVEQLLVSLEQSSCKDFEVIIVDQNREPLLDAICQKFASSFPLTHLKVDFRGAARARNYGLTYAHGEIINFPDDDCELTTDLLANVSQYFREHPETDALFGRAIDPASRASTVTSFADRGQWVTPGNLYHTTVEFTMFIPRSVLDEVGPLDEDLGVGTFFGAEEGADFVLRALYLGKRLYYDPALIFYHPPKIARYDEVECNRAYNYGKGFGRLSVKHVMMYRKLGAAKRFAYFQTRALVAALLALAQLKPDRSKYYRQVLRGRSVGAWHAYREFRSRS